MHLQRFNFSSFIHNKLKEELVNRLEMRPCGIYQVLLLFHADTFPRKPCLLEDGKRPEDVLFDHVDNQIQMGDNDGGHAALVGQVVIELL